MTEDVQNGIVGHCGLNIAQSSIALKWHVIIAEYEKKTRKQQCEVQSDQDDKITVLCNIAQQYIIL